MQDGATHARLRRLVSIAFTPARVRELEPFIERVVDDLIDRMDTTADLVPAFAEQVPMAVICELFGVPHADRGSLRLMDISALLGHRHTGAGHRGQPRPDSVSTPYWSDAKRRSEDNDLTTALVRAHDDDGHLSPQELVDSLHLMLVAGHETTLHLLGNAVVALLTHPEQLAAVVELDRWSDAIEETLRLHPPVAGALFRYALQDVIVAGVMIPAGDAVCLCYSGAATDPAAYGQDAAHFDIDRKNRSSSGLRTQSAFLPRRAAGPARSANRPVSAVSTLSNMDARGVPRLRAVHPLVPNKRAAQRSSEVTLSIVAA